MHRIGIIGGMFDPVHNGHLRIALECKEALKLDQLHMVPCAVPPHREAPSATAEQRLEMLKVALENVNNIVADDREIQRLGASYTVDTLSSLREDFPHSKLFLIIGSDAFQYLDRWHRWQDILKLANIVIAKRPDYTNDRTSEVGRLLEKRFVSNLDKFLESDSGSIFIFKVRQLEISSSLVRGLFDENKSAQFLVPDSVLKYIKENNLYRL